MRILVLTTSFPRSASDDAGIFVARLVGALSRCGASGLVLAPGDRGAARREERGTFAVLRVWYGIFGGQLAYGAGIVPNLRRRPWLLLEAVLLVLSFILSGVRQRRSFDVVQANWIGAGVAAWVIHILTRKPFVVTLRGEDMRLVRSPWGGCLRFILRRAQAVVAVSEEFTRDAAAILGEKCAVHWIPNGTDAVTVTQEQTEALRHRLHLPADARVLLFAGRVIRLKRLEMLVQGMNQLFADGFFLLVCGRVADEEYRAELEGLISPAAREQVRFLGPVPPEEMPPYFRLASAYVTASEYEGRPNSVLEALSSGTRVLASDIPAHRQVVPPDRGNFFQDVRQFVQLVRQLSSPPTQKGGLALPSWEDSAREYLRVLGGG